MPIPLKMFLPLVTFVLFFLPAARPAEAGQPLILQENLSRMGIGHQMDFLVDPGGRLTREEVSSPARAGEFTPCPRDNPSFGYVKGALWLRLPVRNPGKGPAAWLLEFNYPIADHLELYTPSEKGFAMHRTGDQYPFNNRPVRYRTFVFPVTSPPGDSMLYLRVQTKGSLTVPVNAWNRDSFDRKKDAEQPLLWMYYGLMLSLFLYNMFIFFSTREKSHLYLSLFTVAIALYTFIHNGLAFQFLWPNQVWWGNISHPLFIFASIAGAIQFTRSFLNLRMSFPRMERILTVSLITCCVLLLTPFLFDYYYITQVSTVAAGLSAVIMLTAGSILLVRGYRQARFYMTAWGLFILGTILTSIRAYGLIPDDFLAAWSYQIGSSLLVLLLSLGVADKINEMRLEREKALKALRESEEKYRSLVENAHVAIVLMIGDRPVYANPATFSISGYREEDFYLMRARDFIPDIGPYQSETIYKYYKKHIEGGEDPFQHEGKVKIAGGRIIDVYISSARVSIGDQKGVITIFTDISRIKEAELKIMHQYEEIQSQYEELEALNESLVQTHHELLQAHDNLNSEKERLSVTLKSINEGVITADTQGDIVLFNPAAQRLTGFTAEEAEGRSIESLLPLCSQKTGEPVTGYMKRILEGDFQSAALHPLVLTTRDGSRRTVEIAGAPIIAGEGHRAGMVLIIRDITEKQMVDQELLKISKLESLSILAGGVAHDFNNILMGILGNITVARHRQEEENPLFSVLEKIEKASERASYLTQQLLTFSKGGYPLKKTVSLGDLLRESADFILTGTSVRCDIRIEENLKPADADANQISQVFNNIIINAVQAMPDGGILRIRAENVSSGDNPHLEGPHQGYVRISFQDEGMGIPEENIGSIFDPFFSTKETGSGLGLASSYSIVKRHEGHIEVQSRPGEGTRFDVYLPASDKEIDREQETESPLPSRGGRVLLMDDDETIRDVTIELLDLLGYETTCVDDGELAIQVYQREFLAGRPYDVLIMDLTVPGGMGGKEALRRIREFDPHVTAVISSGYSNDPVLSNFQDYGFQGFLRKPFSLQEMTRVFNEILGDKNGRGA